MLGLLLSIAIKAQPCYSVSMENKVKEFIAKIQTLLKSKQERAKDKFSELVPLCKNNINYGGNQYLDCDALINEGPAGPNFLESKQCGFDTCPFLDINKPNLGVPILEKQN